MDVTDNVGVCGGLFPDATSTEAVSAGPQQVAARTIRAAPIRRAVTVPSVETVAIESFVDLHVKVVPGTSFPEPS
jgi:hypothetical protein